MRFDAGNGRVESVSMTVQMDDGLVQRLDVEGGAFQAGDRVEITRDGRIIRR